MIGKFDRKIKILESTTERTDTGALKATGSTEILNDWCRLEPASDTKRLEYSKIGYDNTYTVTLANRPGLTVKQWAIKCHAEIDGERYEIIGAYIYENRMYIRLEVHQ